MVTTPAILRISSALFRGSARAHRIVILSCALIACALIACALNELLPVAVLVWALLVLSISVSASLERAAMVGHRSRVTGHRSRVTGHRSRVTGHGSRVASGEWRATCATRDASANVGNTRESSMLSSMLCRFSRHLCSLVPGSSRVLRRQRQRIRQWSSVGHISTVLTAHR